MTAGLRESAPRVVEIGSGAPRLWIVAGVHGDEVEGVAVVEDAIDTLVPESGTVLAVPVAHPEALRRGTRIGVDGVDLNRIYPGDVGVGPTHATAGRLWSELLERGADALITLHSAGRSGDYVPYVEFRRGDDAGLALARATGIPYVEAWDWPEGLLPNVAARSGIAACEIELGGLGRHTPAHLVTGLRAVRGAAAFLGMLGESVPDSGRLVQRHELRCDEPGRVRQLCRVGADVLGGDAVAELRGLDGRRAATLTSPCDGVVALHATYGCVEPGDLVAVVFQIAEEET